MQYARNVHFQIKPGKEKEFTTLFENEVLPMLRKQNGFQNELTLVNPQQELRESYVARVKPGEVYKARLDLR